MPALAASSAARTRAAKASRSASNPAQENQCQTPISEKLVSDTLFPEIRVRHEFFGNRCLTPISSALAAGAVVGRALADDDGADRRAAAPARLALAVVDVEVELEV